MEFTTLNTGARMPMEGFGVYQITDLGTTSRTFIVPSATPALFLFPPALPRSL